ncbi:MAG: hypothetical protein JNJ48_04180, partial [Phycisphaerae bacterium]|nr:hypothetical protein [Phycisphaerae bacterium]
VSRPIARITGVGGRWLIQPGHTPRLHLAGAGTAVRFLTAAALLAPPGAAIEIDGDDRMRQRPIADLTDALALLGASVQSTGAPARLPLRIMPPRDLASLPARVAFTDPPSSQFISALMLAACFLPRPLTIEVRGQLVSEPYVDMTWKLIQRALRRTPITSHTRGVLSFRFPVVLPYHYALDN